MSRDLIIRGMPQPATVKRPETPLATANWETGYGPLRRHEGGDFLLGYQAGGIPVGVPDDRHVLLVGGTRGGKGVSFLVPNLCLYPGSVVVIDPKGENAIITARRRGGGSQYARGLGCRVVLLDPFHAVQTPEDSFADLRSGYNPLDLVDPARPESIDDASRIADALVVSEGSKDPYWEESARAFIKAVILHVASAPDYASARNLVTVRALLMAGDTERQKLAGLTGGKKTKTTGLSHLFAQMKRNKAFGGAVAQAGAMFGNLEENATRTMANIAQIACTNTDFIESPGMQKCLERSGFQLHDLKTDEQGLSLFMSLPQSYMGTHYRWLRMMVTLMTAEMERYRQRPASGHAVLMVLDEFPALKRMRVIENAAAQIAGFGVRLVMVVQTLAQLKDTYKENWETLVANAGVKLFFANDDHFTRDYASKLIGERELVRVMTTVSETSGTSTSTAKGKTEGITTSDSFSFSTNEHGKSVTTGKSFGDSKSWTNTTTTGNSTSRTVAHAETLHKRPLLTPDEVGRQFGNRDNPMVLTLVSGHQPMALKRMRYFREDWMLGLYGWHPDHARPPTLKIVEARRVEAAAKAKADAERRELEARWEAARERNAEIASQKFWAEDAKKMARLRRNRQLKQRMARLALVSVSLAIIFASLKILGFRVGM
jgi:type IV secretory pathway TraG/TraD family ATPase VirD4